jgi:ABC-2 type transport system ATP-binding protein
VAAVIRARGLTKRFGALVAVDGLDLEVAHGEVFGYLGPNGAGKTTTIRLLLDFLRPTAGDAEVLGARGADPAVRGRIGYLPGELQLDPRYTAADVVAFYGALRGGVDHAVVARLYERFDLDPRRPVGELSTGNRRKVGIVQAFMHRPELLILDEPTSGLDPLLQHEVHGLLQESVRDGATVFLSSHVLPEVEALASRLAILRSGRLLTVATIDELRAQARSRIELHLRDSVDPQVLARVPGVVEATGADGVLHVVVEGSVDPLIKVAARYEVQRIVTHDTDLEDVFLALYAKGDE